MATIQEVNFRATSGFVSGDSADAHIETSTGNNYPTVSAQGVTLGWTSAASSIDRRNVSAGINPKLAGIAASNSGVTACNYRVNLTALGGPGTYRIRVAMGDDDNARPNQKLEVFDDSSSLGVLINGPAANHRWLDATGVELTATTWPTDNDYVDLVFTSNIANFLFGTGSNNWAVSHISIEKLVTGPTVTSVSTGTPREGASLTITGTAFGASQGSGDVKINGVAQTVTAWADTSITVTVVLGTNKFGAAYTVVVRDNALVASNSYAGITGLLPASSALSYQDIGTPNTTATNRIQALPDLASGRQVEYDNNGGTTIVATDGTFTTRQSFSARAWVTGDGWGARALQSFTNASGGSSLSRTFRRFSKIFRRF